MGIRDFMAAYKHVWEARDPAGFAALFTPDGCYFNTPFQIQTGAQELAHYWERILLQNDIALTYKVLADTPDAGIGHWNVTYQVRSEELFGIWAKSTGTGLPDRKPGDPLPRMELDGMLQARFDPATGLAREVRIWWHSIPRPARA